MPERFFQVTEAIQAHEVLLKVVDDTGTEIKIVFTHKGSGGTEIVSSSLEITVNTAEVTIVINENDQPQVFPSEATLSAGVSALVDKLNQRQQKIEIAQIMKTSLDKKSKLKAIIEN